MKVVILAGGLGTRLSEETDIRPKPMVEIGGKPIIWHIMKHYSHYGFNEFVVCLGYKGYVIKEFFANLFLHLSDVTIDLSTNEIAVHNSPVDNWKITLVETGSHTMTGGRIKRVQKYINNERFLLTYGDGVGNVDISKLLEFHEGKKKMCTVTAVQPSGRFGVLQINDTNDVESFHEKRAEDSGWINGGFFVCEPEVFNYIEDDDAIWERDPLETIAQKNQLASFKHHGFWKPMDSLKDKMDLNQLWNTNQAEWKSMAITMNILNNFSGKKVFITGRTGFKGSWLSYWLHSLGAEVKGYALPPATETNLFDALKLRNAFQSALADINNYDQLAKEIENFQPDFIFHLAAQPLVRKSYRDPLDTFQTNVVGTANVLNALRNIEKPCVCVCITTDKVYQNNEWIYPYRENDRLGGYDPYSASKACSELVISSFSQSYFNVSNYSQHKKAIASARAGNVIGGGDWSEDRLLPDIVRALSKNEEIIIRNPNSVRPWQHVMEPLFGYMQLALSLQSNVQTFSGGWNFGPQTEDNFSVIDLSKIAVEIWGEGKINVTHSPNAPHEAHLLRLDISKAIGELEWIPKMRAVDAIKRTIEWYKGFYNGGKVEDLMSEDFKYYQSLFTNDN